MMLHINKLAKLTLEFDNELLSFSHFKNYPNYLPYIGKDYSNSKKKILIIAESHFYPDEDFYKNIDINDFYNKKVDFKDLNFMFTRFELTRIEKHRIHQILEKFVNYEEIAYYNFFLRPASNKKSLIVKAIDKEYSNNAFKVITNALCPDKIIFVSKKSFDALSIENKKTYKEKIFYCVHPNSFWWHKTMKKYGNKKGKEIFTNQTLGNPNFDFDNSVVVANNDDLKVFSNIENIESIVIYDLLGRTIFTKENINAKQFVVPVEKVHAPLIMKIKLANGIVVERKTIF